MRKNILITGASSGFGYEVALRLAKDHHVIAGVKDYGDMTRLQKEAKERKIELKVVKLDLLDDFDIENLEKLNVDILVNNSGVGQSGPIIDLPFDRLKQNIDVNVFGTFKVTQVILRKMVKNKVNGKVLFVSSVVGIESIPMLSPYCMSKHAIEAMAVALRQEVAVFGIKVGTINPGAFNTGFNDRIMGTQLEWYDKNTSLTPEKFYHQQEDFLANHQFDPEEMIQGMVDIIPKEDHVFRLCLPLSEVDRLKKVEQDLWSAKM